MTATIDDFAPLLEFLCDVLDGEEFDAVQGIIDNIVSQTGDPAGTGAMDQSHGAAKMNFPIKVPTARVMRGVQQYETARAEVEPYVGNVGYAFDSAGAVYAHALRQMGHDVSGLAGQPDAARAVFMALKGKH